VSQLIPPETSNEMDVDTTVEMKEFLEPESKQDIPQTGDETTELEQVGTDESIYWLDLLNSTVQDLTKKVKPEVAPFAGLVHPSFKIHHVFIVITKISIFVKGWQSFALLGKWDQKTKKNIKQIFSVPSN